MGPIFKKLVTSIGTTNESARDEWVTRALQSLPPGSRIIDVGAGEQRYKPYCSHLQYVSQDFCQYDGKGDGRALQTGNWDTCSIDIVSDISAIPSESGSFDVLLCTEVFEHVPDPISALREFHRLLRPGGQLILTAPFCSFTHMAPFHFYSGFNKYFYEKYLSEIGFDVVGITANGDYPEFMAQELRRVLTMNAMTPFIVKCCIAILIRYMNKFRKLSNCIDIGDLLCFGYHVLASKR
ncbi:MAG: class I SAM-dependent methyltransferase [Geobacteraceae bacterium]|nr:class I SAM-dependent methyltransferase [Geobacteraceae bacterium]